MNMRIVPKIKVISSVDPYFQGLVNDFIKDPRINVTDIKINTVLIENERAEHHAYIFYEEFQH
nr:hypothetical protein [uncultured Trichococcus sp.]